MATLVTLKMLAGVNNGGWLINYATLNNNGALNNFGTINN